MFRLFASLLLVLALSAPVLRADSETMPERTLKSLADRQKVIFDDAEKAGEDASDVFRVQLQQICEEYELLIHANPDFVPGYVAYGVMLRKIGMRKEAATIMLKAYKLDPGIALVNNQIGNFLAEENRPLDAIPYFMTAIKLDPKQPIYHYDLGQLLYAARDDFIKSGDWTSDSIYKTSHEAFGRAAELAPDRIEFTYRYAESFSDMLHPDWDGALKAWGDLEKKAQSPQEREIMILQEANVLIQKGDPEAARAKLAEVDDPGLAAQKQKLVAQLPAAPAK